MEIREEQQDTVTIVTPVGRLDSASAPALDERLAAMVAGGARRVVVDFSQVEYISSAGLRVMLVLAKKLKDGHGALALCGMLDTVREVFNLAGFLRLFTIEAARSAAVTRVTA